MAPSFFLLSEWLCGRRGCVQGHRRCGGTSGSRIAYAADRVLSLVRGADDVRRRASQGIGVSFAAATAVPGALMPLGAALTFLLRPDVLGDLITADGLLMPAIRCLALDVKRLRIANREPVSVAVVAPKTFRLSPGW